MPRRELYPRGLYLRAMRRNSARKPLKMAVEALESRIMLDGAGFSSNQLPAAIVVGRTLSSYTAPGIQNNQETITYTVYNEQADPETGVLLTTTLEPGVTYASASQSPDQSGLNLAWSLGTIPGHDRASVTLTMNLANPVPLRLDSGANAFATLDGGSVTNSTPAAILTTRTISADLLASTPDANTTDPFIQEEAAKLNYDPQHIFDFLHTQIGYNSYTGSVRGARGALWSSAGNALDVASLGVALMRASGIPAQYAQGNLSFSQAQQLIRSMFPASLLTVGYIPSGTQTADPADDGQLLTETEAHNWFQIDTGSGMQDADPLMAGAKIGQTFTTSSDTFAEVPDDLRAKTEVKLNAEIYSQASALFGFGGGLSTTTVLDHTFNDVDLVGRPLSVGNFVSSSGAGFIISATTNTYTPYIIIGDDALNESQLPEAIVGQPYQEVLTNFPLGSQVLTGLFLSESQSGPGTTTQTYTQTLADRIGYAARQGLAGASSLSINPTGPPAITPFDLTTLNILPGLQSPGAAQLAQERASQTIAMVASMSNPSPVAETSALVAIARADLANFAVNSDQETANLARGYTSAAYFDSPRITAFSSIVVTTDNKSELSFNINLAHDSIRAIASPGQNAHAPLSLVALRGIYDSYLEAQSVAAAGGVNLSSSSIIQQSMQEGIPMVAVDSTNLTVLQTLRLPADALARITTDVQNGLGVIVPSRALSINGTQTTAWWLINPTTGEIVSQGQNGGYQSTVLFGATLATSIITSAALNVAITALYPGIHNPQELAKAALIGAVGGIFPFSFLGFFGAIALLYDFSAIGPLASLDPPVSTLLVNLNVPYPTSVPGSTASAKVGEQPNQTPGQLSGTVQVSSTAASGTLTARWASNATSSLVASSFTAVDAKVIDSRGQIVGTGSAALSSQSATVLSIAGSNEYSVHGAGSLAFYGPAESALGGGGDWQNYTATVTGNVAITLTVPGGVLVLSGQPLPAGTYTIATASATLAGSGTMSAPNFAGAVSISATNSTIDLGPGSGSLSVGGKLLSPQNQTALDGYTGTISVAAGGNGTDTVGLIGSARNVLQIATGPAKLTTDQNTPVTFKPSIETSLADTYSLIAHAPPGWTIKIDASGNVTATPAPGLQSGTYQITTIAQSATDASLIAQTTADVTITPTQPAMSLDVAADTLITVPYNGAELPTAFRATIQNLGPAADTYNLVFSNVPSGFTLSSSGKSVTVPAGQTGLVGLYLVANPGYPLPAPGTQLSFTVTATSTTDSKITTSQSVSVTIPAIAAVTVRSNHTNISSTPGAAVTDILTITNVGNVPESGITPTAATPSGLILTGLSPVSLAVGQSTTETVTLTPAASMPLDTELQATITTTYGPSASPQTQTLNLVVDLVVPGAAAIANASVAANLLGKTGLVGRLSDLSTALTDLVQNPTSAVYKGQALANLESLISQLTNDPFLSGFTAGLTAARAALPGAVTAAEVQTAVSTLGAALDSLATVISDDAEHGFTLSLSPDRNIVQPGAPEVFDIVMTNKGSAATTYDLGVTGLPAGVTAVFSQPSLTLQTGQSTGPGNNAATLTLTESGGTLVPANFTVSAVAEGAMEISQSAPGFLTLRDESILVAGVVTNPLFTDPGGLVDVSAKIQSAVNEPTSVSASYTVTDTTGKVLFMSSAIPVALSVTSGLTTTDLGNIDTTGFTKGVDTITVSLSSGTGQPIPGASATTSLLIGQPVTGSLSTSPMTVPTGSDVVTSTVTFTTQATYPTPLTLQGAVTTPAPGTSVALFQSGGKTYAYESGIGGIDALDVTDPTNPTLLEVFGQNDITSGKFGFNVAKVVNGELIVGTSNGNNGSVFNLLVYSLSNPASPQLVSNTTINYRFLSDLLVNSTGTAAFVPTNGFFYSGSTIYQDFGDFVSIDLSDPTMPALGSSLFTNQGQPDGGDMNQFGGTLVNDQIAYSAGLAPGGGTIIGNTGNLLVVNVADPKNMSLIEQLRIPGTVNILNVATHGNRALVIGSAGIESNIFNPNLTGVYNHLTLTVLDITDPANPQILGSTFVTNEQFPLNEAGAKTDVVDLGNGDFAVSDTDEGGNPALLVIDPTDPNNIVVAAAQVPSGVHGITVSGDLLYASTSSGLSIYQIGQLKSDAVTISVSLPPSTAANIVASSYNIPPSQVVTGTSADTLVWNRSFSAGDTTFTFTWQTKVSGVQPGRAVPVTLGATISYVNQGTPGTLTLPGTSVIGTPIISISPTSLIEQPGGTATYDVRLENPTAAQVSYNLEASGLFGVVVGLPPGSVSVAAGGTVDVPLTLTSDVTAQAGAQPFTVTADYVLLASDNVTQLGEFKGSASSRLIIAGQPVIQPDPEAHGVVVSLSPARAVAGQGTSASYVIQLTNVGSSDDHFNLSVAGLPSGVSASFGQNQFSLDVPPGASNFRDVNLILATDTGTPPGDVPFTVTATSTSLPSVLGSAQGTLGVVASGVAVGLDPQSNKPGAGFHLTVTNTGTVQDTFDLALAGPAALVSNLGASKITLAPGASQVVPITTGRVTFAVPGSLDLTAMATSETNPAVRNGASANLDIATTTGLTAQFSPPSQTLSAPGQTSFLLQVNNTGNVQDSYSAVITGTTGLVIASLVGLDGQPTASIPLFQLPGLSSGALRLEATMTGPGQATVTVVVTSLSTGQTTTLTANITSGVAVTSTDGPRITALKRYGIHMNPTTIVLTFDQPLDPTRAQDVKEYHLVGPAGHTIPIKSAVYDPTTMTVTLFPRDRINLHHTYKLTVYGATPNGLTGSTGLLLDGKEEGKPGSNYVATISFANLVLPPNWKPKWTAQFVHHKSHAAVKQARHSVEVGKHPLSQRTRPFQARSAAKPSVARSHTSVLHVVRRHFVRPDSASSQHFSLQV